MYLARPSRSTGGISCHITAELLVSLTTNTGSGGDEGGFFSTSGVLVEATFSFDLATMVQLVCVSEVEGSEERERLSSLASPASLRSASEDHRSRLLAEVFSRPMRNCFQRFGVRPDRFVFGNVLALLQNKNINVVGRRKVLSQVARSRQHHVKNWW